MKEANRSLAKVKDPILVIQGDSDPVVNPDSSTSIYERVSSKEKKLVLFPRANHIIVNSEGSEEIFESMHRFVSDVMKKTEEI
jgi:esterase/lipase